MGYMLHIVFMHASVDVVYRISYTAELFTADFKYQFFEELIHILSTGCLKRTYN
jgi:hypothetical protein